MDHFLASVIVHSFQGKKLMKSICIECLNLNLRKEALFNDHFISNLNFFEHKFYKSVKQKYNNFKFCFRFWNYIKRKHIFRQRKCVLFLFLSEEIFAKDIFSQFSLIQRKKQRKQSVTAAFQRLFFNQFKNNLTQKMQVEIEDQFPTISFSEIINDRFISIYHKALKYSNLQLNKDIKYRNIPIYEEQHMHQIYTTGPRTLPHLVLIHGYGGTSLSFIRTFYFLKNHFQVHALDTFGVGLSSRNKWKDNFSAQQTINYYIDAIQQWRKNAKIQKFILAGHSFGGYISTCYYEKYSENVQQLILISPAGSSSVSDEDVSMAKNKHSTMSWWIWEYFYKRELMPSKLYTHFIYGEQVMHSILSSLKLESQEMSVWKKYWIFVSNLQQSSEPGFFTLFKWPLQPIKCIEKMLTEKQPKIKIDFVFGDRDWMYKSGAQRLNQLFSNINLHYISNSGHQISFDNPQQLSTKICQIVSKCRNIQSL